MSAQQAIRIIPLCAIGALTGRNAVTGYRAAKRGQYGPLLQVGRFQAVKAALVEAFIGRPVTDAEILRAVEAYQAKQRRTYRHRPAAAPAPQTLHIVIENRRESKSERAVREFQKYRGE